MIIYEVVGLGMDPSYDMPPEYYLHLEKAERRVQQLNDRQQRMAERYNTPDDYEWEESMQLDFHINEIFVDGTP